MKRKMKKENNRITIYRQNQKGMALIATIILIFVIVSIGIALLTMTNRDTQLSTLQRASNKAFYLADAGIEDTFWKLNNSILKKELIIKDDNIVEWWSSNAPLPGTANEYYQVSIQDNGIDADGEPMIKIISEGIVDDAKFSSGKRIVEATAKIDYITTTMYDYAILSDKVITFLGNPGVDLVGDVHSNDDILVSPKGGIFASNYTGTATCSGDTNELSSGNVGAAVKPIPPVDYAGLKIKSDNAVNTFHGNKTLGNKESWGTESNPLTGIHFIDGDLEAKNGSKIWIKNGALIVAGNVSIKNGAVFEIHNDDDYINSADPDTALALVAMGDIKIHAKSAIEKGVVQSVEEDGVTTKGYIELDNGAEVTGSLIANTVILHNKTTVSYPPSGLTEITVKGDPFFVMTSWREI